MLTASWIPLIIAGSDIRATPPSRRMSDGTRSSAITAQAPASSAIPACSGVTTSMITPPFSISARPVLTRKVARSVTSRILRLKCGRTSSRIAETNTTSRRFGALLQLVGTDAVFVRVFVTRVKAVRQSLDQSHQCRVGAGKRWAVGGVIEGQLGVLADLGHRGIGDRQGAGAAVHGELHRPQKQWVRPTRREDDDERLLVDSPKSLQRLAAGAGDDLRPNIEQAERVAQVTGEKGHLIDADDDHALGLGQRCDGAVDLLAGQLAGRFLEVGVVGAERSLQLGVIEGKERAGAGRAGGGSPRGAVLLDRRLL